MNGIDTIVNMSYAYFALHGVTPDTINAFIVRMQLAFPEHVYDADELFRKLENIHSVTINGSTVTLEEAEGHNEWFNVSTNLPINRDFEWHFWEQLKQYLLTQKNRTKNVVNALDRDSSEILSHLEDPLRAGSWDRRGMVMGSVQSGKTSNFTALICKAIDSGYKLIIVLAGVHNSLRSQTQDRLNEELLGYDLDRVQKLTGEERRIGVGKMFKSNHKIVNTLTSSSNDGDFNSRVTAQAGMIPSNSGDPIILVIKKHTKIMQNLYIWLSTLPLVMQEHNRKVIPEIPMLLIDDECDFASVNTKKPEYDGEGKLVKEWNPTETNKMIRKILHLFHKSAYVGYTATPYANIFIHKDDYHPTFGDDLFPKHFITSLPQPDNYVGPDRLFGMPGDDSVGIDSIEPLPLLVTVEDHVALIPDSHKISWRVSQLPGTLKYAMKSFFLVCAARRIRKSGNVHNSMLIHVTKWNAVQSQVKVLVEEELQCIVGRMLSGTDPLTDFHQIWEKDFTPKTVKMASLGFHEANPINWSDIKNELYESTKRIAVKGINGEIGDILDYRDQDARVRDKIEKGEIVPWEDKGISVIAVGGDKLSRGLTLDGLSISYYLRSCRMYDTLMQMGRWFGYRDGYNDLCRIFTTEELKIWYRHISFATKELRNQLEYMAAIKSSPEKFGLKVRTSPGRLAITSAGKSRNAEEHSITFSGEMKQTILFDPRHLDENIKALEIMVEQIGKAPRALEPNKPIRYHWDDVEAAVVINFLRTYRAHEDATRVVNPQRIADFIEKQNSNEELIEWHVVIVSNELKNSLHTYKLLNKYPIGCVKRTSEGVLQDKIPIGVLTSPSDEFLDLNKTEYDVALEFDKSRNKSKADGTPTPMAIRHVRPKSRGLMLIYMPCCVEPEHSKYGLKDNEVVGFAVSFPASDTTTPIKYWANPVCNEDL